MSLILIAWLYSKFMAHFYALKNFPFINLNRVKGFVKTKKRKILFKSYKLKISLKIFITDYKLRQDLSVYPCLEEIFKSIKIFQDYKFY